MKDKHNFRASPDKGPFKEISHALQGCYSHYLGIALAIVVLIMYCLVINSSWKAIPDGALYLELGESIARGDGYVFNGEPHTYVPPGYPGIVAAVVALAGKNFTAYRALMACLGILTALAGYFFILRLCGSDTALIVGGLFAVNHVLLSNSTFTSSDVPFSLNVFVALNAILGVPGSKTIWLWSVLAGVIAGLPAVFRVNGWGVPPALAVFLFCATRNRSLALRLGSTSLFILSSLLPTIFWDLHRSSFPNSPNEGTYLNAIGGRTLETQAKIILTAAWDYFHEITYALSGLSVRMFSLELIIPLLVLIGIAAALRNKERLLAPFTLIQFGGLLLSPAGSRYLIALLPGLYLFFALGVLGVVARVRRRFPGSRSRFLSPRFVILGLFSIMALINFAQNLGTVFHARTPCEIDGAESVRDVPFFASGQWLQENASNSIVLTMHPRVIHYLSGLPTVELVRSGVPEHQVWIDNVSDLRRLISERRPQYFFSDASQANLFSQVLEALGSLDLKLEDINLFPSSGRFRLWRIVGKEGKNR